MRKFSALAFISLLALTGCAAPVGEAAPATVTVTASSEAQSVAEVEPTPIAPRELTKSELDEYLGWAELTVGAYGFDKREFPKALILAESKKVCAQGADYKGLPMLNKVGGATDAFVFRANSGFC